jgi:hypothetical protein
MTEAEWLAATDPKEILGFFGDMASDRKLRHFAIACCRCSEPLTSNKDHRNALEISCRYADGLATDDELEIAYQRANDFACGIYGLAYGKSEQETRRWAEATAVANALADPKRMVSCAVDAAWMIHRAAEHDPNERLTQLLKDICRNPFRPIAFGTPWFDLQVTKRVVFPFFPVSADPSWLTSDVRALAEGIYQNRAFDRMPILADALQDAGCYNDDILNHCRQPGEHVRGCWCVDLLLGKS